MYPDSLAARACAETIVGIPAGEAMVWGTLTIPPAARGVVLFADVRSNGRFSTEQRDKAAIMERAGFATLRLDLLTPTDVGCLDDVLEPRVLASRLATAVAWVRRRPEFEGLAVGLYGAGTGATVALVAAASLGNDLSAVVACGGGVARAGEALHNVQAATLCIEGARDRDQLEATSGAMRALAGPSELIIIPGASRRLDEPVARTEVTRLATQWFDRFLGPSHMRLRRSGAAILRPTAGSLEMT